MRAQWGDVRPGGVIKLSLEVSIHLKKTIITSASANYKVQSTKHNVKLLSSVAVQKKG